MKKNYKLIIIGALLCVCLLIALFISSRFTSGKQIQALSRSCTTTQGAEKKSCWDSLIRSSMKKYGSDTTLELVALLYEGDPEFANPCHSMVHIIGQGAYLQFNSTGEIPLSDKTAYCSFGFYHGFMEMLVAKKTDITVAQKFCKRVDETIGKTTPGARLGCYHGMGHGSTDVHNPKYFGDERALIAPALKNCEAFAQTPEQIKICATGVFDSISIAYYNADTNGLVMKKDDPLWLCREMPDVYKEPCYLDMMPAVFWLADHTVGNAIQLVLDHAEATYKQVAVKTVVENSIRFIINISSPIDLIATCRSLESPYAKACIQGIGEGMLQFGKPGVEYQKAIQFCGDTSLTKEESDWCFESIAIYSRQRYSKEKLASICSTNKSREYIRFCEK